MSTHDRLGRRNALVGIGAAAVGVAVGVPLASRAAGTVRADAPANGVPEAAAVETDPKMVSPAPAGDPVRRLFGPLGEGSAVSTHWRLEALHRVRAGAIPVVMSAAGGARFAVEIFRLDHSGPAPVATAGQLAFHLVNDGDGSSPTTELSGLGAMALASELEARLAAGASIPDGLSTHRERVTRDPDGAFDVPLV